MPQQTQKRTESDGPFLFHDLILVQYDIYMDQLRQVVEHFSNDPLARILTRCLRSNEPLKGIDRSAVRERVPPHVYETRNDFKTCGCCGRIYWKGTHWVASTKQVMRIFGIQE